jgi:DNA-binding response OmpR family regulator
MDDSEVILHALKSYLMARGYDVRVTANLAELEVAIKEERPDLFVLDVQMPEMYGDDVAQVLREVRSMKTPVILFSDIPEESLTSRARGAGVAGYVTKSAGMGVLADRIEEVISRS